MELDRRSTIQRAERGGVLLGLTLFDGKTGAGAGGGCEAEWLFLEWTMASAYRQDTIENWVSDFCMSDAARGFLPAVREVAGEVLVVFLGAACAVRDVEPGDVEEGDLKVALLEHVARLNVGEEVRGEIPRLCGAFLGQLEEEGRLGGGRLMGAYVAALGGGGGAFAEAASGKKKPEVRAGARIGRNDPCPCGSGKKYKKCCGG